MDDTWLHLRHQEGDTEDALQQKLSKLQSVERQLQHRLQRLVDQEHDQFRETTHWRCIGGMDVLFPSSLKPETVTFSPSKQYMAGVFDRGDAISVDVFETAMDQKATGLRHVASLSVKFKDRITLQNQSIAVLDGPPLRLILSSAIVPTAFRKDAIVSRDVNSTLCIAIQKGSCFELENVQTTQIHVCCLFTVEDRLFAGGVHGTVGLWEWSAVDCLYRRTSRQLPRADAPSVEHTLIKLILVKTDPWMADSKEMLIGLSSEGLLSVWNINKYQWVATFCPSAVRIKDVCSVFLRMKDNEEEVGLLGLSTKMQDPVDVKMVMPLLIKGSEMIIGRVLPPRNVRCLHAAASHGCLLTDDGCISLWDIHQGTVLWRYKETELAACSQLLFDGSSIILFASSGQMHWWRLNNKIERN